MIPYDMVFRRNFIQPKMVDRHYYFFFPPGVRVCSAHFCSASFNWSRLSQSLPTSLLNITSSLEMNLIFSPPFILVSRHLCAPKTLFPSLASLLIMCSCFYFCFFVCFTLLAYCWTHVSNTPILPKLYR